MKKNIGTSVAALVCQIDFWPCEKFVLFERWAVIYFFSVNVIGQHSDNSHHNSTMQSHRSRSWLSLFKHIDPRGKPNNNNTFVCMDNKTDLHHCACVKLIASPKELHPRRYDFIKENKLPMCLWKMMRRSKNTAWISDLSHYCDPLTNKNHQKWQDFPA